MFADLNEDDLRFILETLADELGDQVIEAAIKRQPPNHIKRNVDWLHSTCCYIPHSPEHCCYYDEEDLGVEGWQQKRHQQWIETYLRIVERLDCTHNYFSNMASTVNIIRRKISDDCSSMPPLLEFLRLLMLENSLFLIPTVSRKAPQTVKPSVTEADHSETALSTEL